MRKNKVKQNLLSGKTAFGSFISLESADLVEIFGIAGFDFVVIDNEHGSGDPHSVQHMLRAAEIRGLDTIIRTPNAELDTILKSLDIGASGVQVPMVNDVETAKKIVQGAHYFPEGKRGLAVPRALNYGLRSIIEESMSANEEVLVVCHCETVECFRNLDDIATVPGIDVIFLGPFDISQSLGIPGQVHHPDVLNIVEKSIEIIKKHNKIGGIFCGSFEDVKERLELGYQYITYGVDSALIGGFLTNLVKQLKAINK
jgi:4-hydroxy-2-oxoheptanedioate aldolase